jgi:mannonate dehydratase
MSKPVIIEDVQTIITQPDHSRLIVVKVVTSEPGLYGLGCATFTQRFRAVAAAIESHLKPFAVGRDVSKIEEIWQMAMVNAYWRNGPIMNNAISGLDMALWDIKGKQAGMPVYQLLGGKCREAAAVYTHAGGREPQEVLDDALRLAAEGYRHLRVQAGGYGGEDALPAPPEGAPAGAYFDPRAYARSTVAMIEFVRTHLSPEIELMHDVHERLNPSEAVQLAKDLEPFKLFFLEDALAPEDLEWFASLRQQCSTPLAMGELFVHPLEWRTLVQRRLIDFLRMHLSAIGGLTPARDAAILGQAFGVRTAWHGPGDVSPVGHAANLHLDLWAPNFGIQEYYRFPEVVREVFPGTPEVRNGYMYANDRPGLGVEIDEKLAAKYPCTDEVVQWTQARLPDGSPTRP